MAEEQVHNLSYEAVGIRDDEVDSVATPLRNCNRNRKFLVSSVLAVLLVFVVILAATSTGHLRQGELTSMQTKDTTAATKTKTRKKDVKEEEDKKENEEKDEKEDDENEDEGKTDKGKENDDDGEEGNKETKTKKTTITTTRGRATVPATTRAPAADANPFKDKTFYDSPTHKKDYDYAIKYCTGGTLENLKKMRNVPSAFWVSKKAHIQKLEKLLEDAASKSPPELVVVIWYDLPNRDCASKASTGEICCSKNEDGTCNYDDQTDCNSGLEEYKTTFVDPMVSLLQEYTLEHGVPVVIVVEPDSLPNLATNADNPHCGPATTTAYKTGIKYTVEQLTSKTSVDVYIDAANGAWLGWEKFQVKFMEIIKEMTLPLDKVRGFTTNVAKYQPLGAMCPWEYHASGIYTNGHCLDNKNPYDACCQDPCHLLRTVSPANNELNYVQEVVRAAKGILDMDAHTIIDTSRNGWEGMERNNVCSNWCNLRGAGVGHVPTTDTADPMIDAYFWLKTPGESDGCTEVLPNGTKCARFDESCKSENSIGTRKGEPRVDDAGEWFEYQLKELAANAHLGKVQMVTT